VLKLRSFLRHEDGLSGAGLFSLVSENTPFSLEAFDERTPELFAFELMSSSLMMLTFLVDLTLLVVLVGVESLLLVIELFRLRVASWVGRFGESASFGDSVGDFCGFGDSLLGEVCCCCWVFELRNLMISLVLR